MYHALLFEFVMLSCKKRSAGMHKNQQIKSLTERYILIIQASRLSKILVFYAQMDIIKMRIRLYQGKQSPIYKFIKKLDVRDRAKVLGCLKSLEELGFDTPRVVFRQIRGKLWEIKIKAATADYRIFYVVAQKDNLILLHAYKKQSEKAPIKEIAIAEKRMLEIISNENDYIN